MPGETRQGSELRSTTGIPTFHIFAAERLIGRAMPDRGDRSACTLIGEFIPTAEYNPYNHATSVDEQGRPVAARSTLHVRDPEGNAIAAIGVSIYDFRSSSGDATREVYIVGIPPEIFDTYMIEE